MSKYITRISGALRETVRGIGTTTRGEPFEVADNELAKAMLEQKDRFIASKKPTTPKEE